MASEDRREATGVEPDLWHKPENFSFYQVVRLLRLLEGFQQSNGTDVLRDRKIKIRTKLSLGFPATDVTALHADESQKLEIETSFLGMYGVSSPLPTHYTEDLLDEANEDKNVTRDFLDLLATPFHQLCYESWAKYRWDLRIVEEQSREVLRRLACLAGLDLEPIFEANQESMEILRYIGLLSQYPRSALGLQTILSDALGLKSLEVQTCVLRYVIVPLENRCQVGVRNHQLGFDCCIGDQIKDRMGKIRVVVSVDNLADFYSLLPDGELLSKLNHLLDLYLVEPLECDLVLTVTSEAIRSPRLGEREWCCLGRDTWLFSGDRMLDEAVVTVTCRS